MIDLHLTLDMPSGPTGMHPWFDVLAGSARHRSPKSGVARVRRVANSSWSGFVIHQIVPARLKGCSEGMDAKNIVW
jgi:hypothetical protein